MIMSRSFCDYSKQTRTEPRRGIAVGFSRLNTTALRSMKEDLGLSMTVGELQFCQKMYGSAERSAPTLDEIYFFDGISDGHHRSRDFAAIVKFHLNNPEAAKTYKDLLEKRTLLAGTPLPSAPTLTELSHILSDVLKRSGRYSDFGGVLPIADPFDALSAAARGMLPEDTLSLGADFPPVRTFRTDTKTLSGALCTAYEDDAILLLRTPSMRSAAEMLNSPLVLRLSLFARTELYQKTVHAYRAVDTLGIAIALVSLHDGIYVEIDRIPSVFDDGELYDLAFAEHGSVLVSIPRSEITKFCEAAKEHGIDACQIARAVRGKTLTVRKKGHAPYSFSSGALRELASLSVPMIFEEDREAADLAETPEYSLYPDFGTVDVAMYSPQPILTIGDRFYTAASSKRYSFSNGIDTALSAVFRAVLSSEDPSRLSVQNVFSYPNEITSQTMGGLLESYLGVYRVLSELAIADQSSFLPRSVSTSGFSVYCFGSPYKHRPPSDTLSESGSSIYLVSIAKDQNGVPNFTNVRALLKRLSALCRNGEILSARIGINEIPIELLAAMCGSYEIEYTVSSAPERLKERMNGIVIAIESRSDLKDFWKPGTVRMSKSYGEEAIPLPDYECPYVPISQRRVAVPNVLLIPSADDGNIYALENLFRRNGCEVRILPDFTEDFTTDGVQIAVFCGNSSDAFEREYIRLLYEFPRAIFALRELTERDGIILIPKDFSLNLLSLLSNDEAVTDISDFGGAGVYFHSGLSDASVMKVLRFYR